MYSLVIPSALASASLAEFRSVPVMVNPDEGDTIPTVVAAGGLPVVGSTPVYVLPSIVTVLVFAPYWSAKEPVTVDGVALPA